MATTKVVIEVVFFWLMVVGCAVGQIQERKLSYQAQQCRINRLTTTQPNQKIECEGGLIEMWDQNEEQFQCSGVHAMRLTMQPNSLSLPNYQPSPRLVYIERGEGLLGITFPGCPETYESSGRGQQGGLFGGEEERIRGVESRQRDLHQKVHRFRRGDILAIPAGAVHWCYNDGNEEDVVAVIINDLNNQANQLDQTFRAFYLAGGVGGSGQHGIRQRKSHHQISNIFSAFDSELMAEAFDVPVDLIRRMQQTEDRTLIVRVERGQMRVVSPEEDEEEEYMRRRSKYMGLDVVENGLEETFCTMRVRHNLDSRREADVFSRQGGRLNVVNHHKLPVLRYLDMSAEKGTMFPNTIYSPHWSMNSHSVIYVTRGEAHVQVVGSNGETIMDDRVREGEMFVIPQYFASTCRAGNEGFEYVSFKTTSSPMKSPMVGYTSVFRAMPLQVISNAYQISPSEAQNLKFNREHQTFFLSPMGRSSRTF